jgi:two-component system, LytTR family, sensor kinase
MYIITGVKQRFSDIEFWGLVSFFSVAVLLFSWQGVGDTLPYAAAQQQGDFYDASIKFGYYKHYYIPNILRYLTWFACFMLLQFTLLPKWQEEGVKTSSLVKIGLLFLLTLTINILTDVYLKAYLWVTMPSEGKALSYIFQSNFILSLWLFFAFAVYSLIKYGGLLWLSRLEVSPSKITFVSTPQVALWIMVMLLALLLGVFVQQNIFLIWICVAPVLIIFSNFVYYKLIPAALEKRRPKLYLTVWVVIMASMAWLLVAAIMSSVTYREGIALATAFINAFFLVLVATPVLWFWYHFQQQRKNNLQALEQKLGHSTAQLDQLRTQINPHFLFNALNTVYGLAITEQAPKTSDAIEKISEMMRFMLRENQEAFIPLQKDLDYLRNYIGIQQMRLGDPAQVALDYEIPEEVSPTLLIAPMLMIPFVENAFKHGISLQAPSFIHINIRVEGEKLTFSLHNSTHERIWLNDPEKHNHGIGLNNVKQRLQLLYPDKHLLSIKEQDNAYKVELTVLL